MKRSLLFVILFSQVTFHLSSQEAPKGKNTSGSYWVIKANAAYWMDHDGEPITDHTGYTSVSQLGSGTYKYLTQTSGNLIYPGFELTYFETRRHALGSNRGIAYSFSETFCNYTSSNQDQGPNGSITRKVNRGKVSLINHRIKVVFGFNITSKRGFSFILQPFNPELRLINTGRSKTEIKTYEVYQHKNTYGYSYSDSISTLISSEPGKFSYGGGLTIAFPWSVAFEQKFKIKQRTCVTGINVSASIREEYVVGRIYFGLRFGYSPD